VFSDLSGEVEALNLASGKVESDTKVPQSPLGAVTVSNDLVITTLYDGELIALNRSTGAIVDRHQLPTSTNSPIAIAGNTVTIPAGPPKRVPEAAPPRVVAYTVPWRLGPLASSAMDDADARRAWSTSRRGGWSLVPGSRIVGGTRNGKP
jgi:outer membrane protein assembly factor BamB